MNFTKSEFNMAVLLWFEASRYHQHMFDKQFFDGLDRRLHNYFRRFPSAERIAVVITTNQAEYLLVEVTESDESFITFAHWPLEKADLPVRWKDVKDSLPAVAIPYQEIRSVEFDPKIARGSEIGFNKASRVKAAAKPRPKK
jgi:hypothetical protein